LPLIATLLLRYHKVFLMSTCFLFSSKFAFTIPSVAATNVNITYPKMLVKHFFKKHFGATISTQIKSNKNHSLKKAVFFTMSV